jgi:hypothetical protein
MIAITDAPALYTGQEPNSVAVWFDYEIRCFELVIPSGMLT